MTPALAPPAFVSFEEAYLAVLRHINTGYEYENAPRGNAARESIGVSFRLSDPRQRIPFLITRRVNPVFHFAEALWYLASRNDLTMIGYYAPRMNLSSRDGQTLYGSAHGARLFAPPAGEHLSPFDRVMELLRAEKDSKRGFMPIFTADELAVPNNPDVSCSVGLHLLPRQGQLHAVCYMRANDCDRGLLADVFSFTMIQEFAAVQLGLELGSYTHHIGSAHIGQRDQARVERVLDEADRRQAPLSYPVRPMPADTTFETVASLLAHEEMLRTNQVSYRAEEIAGLGFEPYWQQVLLLFEIYRQICHVPDEPVDRTVLDALEPGMRWLVARRWPMHLRERVAG